LLCASARSGDSDPLKADRCFNWGEPYEFDRNCQSIGANRVYFTANLDNSAQFSLIFIQRSDYRLCNCLSRPKRPGRPVGLASRLLALECSVNIAGPTGIHGGCIRVHSSLHSSLDVIHQIIHRLAAIMGGILVFLFKQVDPSVRNAPHRHQTIEGPRRIVRIEQSQESSDHRNRA